MSSSVNLKKIKIPLKELKRATDNFDSYSEVSEDNYRGKLSGRWRNRTAFIKRYNKEEYESQELEIVSRLHHEDIVSFIGYCDEHDDYMYMVYKYLDPSAHKSLNEALNPHVSFTWPDRLNICIRVAEVLNYLHSGVGELGRVIHGDVKCENIFICGDEDEREVKVFGFKHSKVVPLNQSRQYRHCPEELFKKAHTDPYYKETNLLNTGSDVYSFGVLMFAFLHGNAYDDDDDDHDDDDDEGGYKKPHQLMYLVRGCYDDGLYKLLDPRLIGEVNHRSIQIFTTLAYKCISFDIKERPGI